MGNTDKTIIFSHDQERRESSCEGFLSKGILFSSIFLLLAIFFIFYRFFFLSGMENVPGNLGDSRLNIFIIEHWFRYFQGEVDLLSPPMFFPVKHTLGYTDALFLFSLPYSLFRVAGLDIFTAYQLTLLLCHMLGLYGLFYFLLKIMGFHPFSAVLGSVIGMLSNSLYLAMHHTQLLAIGFLPILMILGVRFLQNHNEKASKRLPYGIGFILLLSALFITGFYAAWFFCLLLGLFWCVYLLVQRIFYEQKKLADLIQWSRSHFKEILFYFFVFILAMIPFLIIYLPVAIEFGPRPRWEVAYMLPTPIDFLNVGKNNLVWGKLFGTYFSDLANRPYWVELLFGLPLFTFLAFILSSWGLLRLCVRKKNLAAKGKGIEDANLSIYFSLCLTVLIMWFLLLRLGSKTSLWWIIYKVVPGAAAIRAVFRIQLVLGIAVGIVVAWGFSYILARVRFASQRGPMIVSISLCFFFLLVEQINLGNAFNFSKSTQLKFLEHVPSPPEGCNVFYIKPDKRKPFWELSIDAILIAQSKDLYTINGYSGLFPKGYGLININDPSFSFYLKFWIGKQKIFGKIAAYDRGQNRWEEEEVRPFEVPEPILGPLKKGEFKAVITVIDPPKGFLVKERRKVKVRIQNTSDVIFTSLGDKKGRYGIKLAYQWINHKGHELGFNNRYQIYELKPGQEKVFDVEIVAPSCSGNYILEFDLIQEVVAWFREKGNQTARVPIYVSPVGAKCQD